MARPSRRQQHAALLYRARKQYDRIVVWQGGETCAICHRPPASRKLDIDHCHKRMVVRGAICVRCNRALPNWVTPEWLRAAAAYLERDPYPLEEAA